MVGLERFCKHLRIPREVGKEIDNWDNVEYEPKYRGVLIKYQTEDGPKEAEAECIYLTAEINEGLTTPCKRRVQRMAACLLESIEFPITISRG